MRGSGEGGGVVQCVSVWHLLTSGTEGRGWISIVLVVPASLSVGIDQ